MVTWYKDCQVQPHLLKLTHCKSSRFDLNRGLLALVFVWGIVYDDWEHYELSLGKVGGAIGRHDPCAKHPC